MATPDKANSLAKEMAGIEQLLVFPDMLPFYQQIKLKRVHDGFTISELARVLGMGVSTLSEIENRHRRCPRKHLARMKRYLYCEMYQEKELIDEIRQ